MLLNTKKMGKVRLACFEPDLSKIMLYSNERNVLSIMYYCSWERVRKIKLLLGTVHEPFLNHGTDLNII